MQRSTPLRVPLGMWLTSGVFSDNTDKTIFEFLESFELGYIDWGNNRQRASKLSNHLSDDLKDKLITRSDNYALMREWLVQNYGGMILVQYICLSFDKIYTSIKAFYFLLF